MAMRRVVVTGLGALTPVGNTAEELWSALKQARSGVGPITKFDATTKNVQGEFEYATRIAGEVKNFDPLQYVDKKEARRLDPFLQYAMACGVIPLVSANSGVDFAPLGFCELSTSSARNLELIRRRAIGSEGQRRKETAWDWAFVGLIAGLLFLLVGGVGMLLWAVIAGVIGGVGG